MMGNLGKTVSYIWLTLKELILGIFITLIVVWLLTYLTLHTLILQKESIVIELSANHLLYYTSLSTLIFAFILIPIFLAIINKLIIQPLNEIAASIRQLAQEPNILDGKLLVQGPKVIQNLSESVNNLLSTLSQTVDSRNELKKTIIELEQHRTIIENSQDAMMIKGRDNRYLMANKVTCDYIGVSQSYLIGKTDFDVFPQDVAQELNEQHLETISKRSILKFRETVPTPDGEVTFETTRIPLFSHSVNNEVSDDTDTRSVIAVIGVCRNITEEVKANKAREDARIAAENANRTKSLFLANVSHEIRTPMNGVIGMAELMRSDNLTHEQHQQLDIINSCGNHLLNLINDILDISKIESGHLKIVPNATELMPLFDEVIQLLAVRAHNKHIEHFSQLYYHFYC